MNPSSTERTTEYWLSKKNRIGRIKKSTVPMRSLLVCMSPRLLEKGDVQKEHPLTANSFSPRAKGRGEKVKAQKTVYCCLQNEDKVFSIEPQVPLQETSKPRKQAGKSRNHSNLRKNPEASCYFDYPHRKLVFTRALNWPRPPERWQYN